MDSRAQRRLNRRERRSTTIFSRLSSEQTALYREAFNFIDKDHDGIISKSDLHNVMMSLGMNPNEMVLEEMLNDVNGDINFTSFLAIFAQMTGEMDSNDVNNAITIMTDNHSGLIDAHILTGLLITGPDRLTRDEIDALLSQLTVSSNNEVDLNDLAKLLTFESSI